MTIRKSAARPFGWLALSAFTALAACNAISGLDDDYQLSAGPALPGEGGAESGSSGDGSVDGTAQTDAARPDGSPVSDASDGGSTWCPTNNLFCENWDDVTTTWTGTENVGGTVTVVDGEGIAGSKALHAHANGVGQSRRVVRWKTIGSSFPDGARYALTFRFKPASIGINYAVIGAIQVNNTQNTNTEYGLAAYRSCTGAGPSPCLDDNNPEAEGSHSFANQVGYQTGTWHHVEISVVRSGTSYRGTIKVDGQAVDTDGNTYFGTPSAPSKVEVGVGIFFTGSDTGTADVYIDEIAATLVP